MKLSFLVLATCAALFGATVGSQAHAIVQPASPNPATARLLVLKSGTAIHLRSRTDLDFKPSRKNGQLALEVAENVLVNGKVLIPVGAPAYAEFPPGKRKNARSTGWLGGRALHVAINSELVPLRDVRANNEGGGTAGSDGVEPISSAFASLAVGSTVTAYTANDLTLIATAP